MPWARTVAGYPTEMRDMIKKIFDTVGVAELPVESLSEAQSIRGRFYQMFGAAQRDAEHAKPPDPAMIEFAMMCKAIEVKVFKDRIVLKHRDKSDFAMKLKAAVFSEAEAGVQSELDKEHEESLLAALARKGITPRVAEPVPLPDPNAKPDLYDPAKPAGNKYY